MLVKTRFIMNPHSGRGRRETKLSLTRKYFEKKIGSFDLVMTRDRDDIVLQTRIALKAGYDQIVALGGDGTVNGIVNGFFEKGSLINPEACLVITKWGTGSDYYKTVMAGSFVSDWKSLVTEHRIRSVDLGSIIFSEQTSKKSTPVEPIQKFFINMSSVGISAAAAQMKNRSPRWVPQSVGYLVPALTAFIRYPSRPVRITRDTDTINATMMALFIGKGLYAGGGMKLGGGVAVDDGLLDVKLFERMKLGVGLKRFPRLFSGRFEDIEEIKRFTSRTLRIESDFKIPVECDGEIYGSTDIEVRVAHQAIRVCWPQE
jgi:diacylglycerol kinase family enzyme